MAKRDQNTNRREADLTVAAASPPRSASTTVVGSGIGDAQLVEDARHGDRDAFGELVRRYERRLLRVIGRFVPDEEFAKDLAQETFIRVYERMDRFDPSKRFGPWLFRIGVNLTLDYLRKRKRRGRWSLFSESPLEKGPDPAEDDPRQARDLEQEVARVLEEIPEKYRMVLVLRDLENFPTSEIAAITGRKEATIRWRLAEARNRFRKLWTSRLEGGASGDTLEGLEVEDVAD